VKVRVAQSGGKTLYWLWCPACNDAVCIDNTWEWNRHTERPTFTPSLLSRFVMAGQAHVCHSFVTDGAWHYLGDCTHDKAGQSIPVVDLPDWVLAE
jgi:hypothetical protein